MIYLILSGIAVGILASVPLGPVNILCIQRTLSRGVRMGFVSSCGIILADTIFSILAVSSISLVVNIVNEIETPLQLAVGVIIMIIGVKIATTDPVRQFNFKQTPQNSKVVAFVSSFLLAINPVNILPILFFTGALKISVSSFIEGAAVIVGVMCGALSCWFGLTSLISHYRNKFRIRHIFWINRILGTFIFILGISACIMAIVKIVEKYLL